MLIGNNDFIHNLGVLVALDARLPHDLWVASFLHAKQVDIQSAHILYIELPNPPRILAKAYTKGILLTHKGYQ